MVDVDLENFDIFFNLTKSSSRLMNGVVPREGRREKDHISMHILIKKLTKLGNMIVVASTSTSCMQFNNILSIRCVVFFFKWINYWL